MGFPFTERNVSEDLEARRQLLAMGFDATPVTVIGNRTVAGFDGPEIDEALGQLRK